MVVYFIQAHRDPQQVLNLANLLLASPDAFVVVSYDSEPPAELRMERPRYAVRQATHRMLRGGFGLMDDYLDVLRWLKSEDVDFRWFVNLSGQCLPVRPPEQITADLLARDDDAVMEVFPAFSETSPWPQWEGRSRLLYQYRRLAIRSLSKAERAILKVPKMMLHAVQPWVRLNTNYGLAIGFRSAPPAGLTLYGGSYFQYISRKCADFLIDYCDRHPEVVSYFRRTFNPVETFGQTMLVNQPFRISRDVKMYFDFRQTRSGHPKMLEPADLDRAKGFDFARKFRFGSPAYEQALARL